MNRIRKVLAIMAFGIGILVMGVVPNTFALTLTIDDLSTGGPIPDIVITDNDSSDGDGTLGVIAFKSSFGAFSVSATVGISKPIIGSPGTGRLDLNSVDVTSSGSGAQSLRITLSDTGFSLVPTLSTINFLTDIGGGTDGTVSSVAIFDPTNTLFGTGGGGLTKSLGLGSFGPGAFSGATGTVVPWANLFSLTQIVDMSFTGPYQATSFNATTSAAVPEPGTILLLGSGLIGMFFFRRRKKA